MKDLSHRAKHKMKAKKGNLIDHYRATWVKLIKANQQDLELRK